MVIVSSWRVTTVCAWRSSHWPAPRPRPCGRCSASGLRARLCAQARLRSCSPSTSVITRVKCPLKPRHFAHSEEPRRKNCYGHQALARVSSRSTPRRRWDVAGPLFFLHLKTVVARRATAQQRRGSGQACGDTQPVAGRFSGSRSGTPAVTSRGRNRFSAATLFGEARTSSGPSRSP
jgi:hypothetical protein